MIGWVNIKGDLINLDKIIFIETGSYDTVSSKERGGPLDTYYYTLSLYSETSKRSYQWGDKETRDEIFSIIEKLLGTSTGDNDI